MAKTCIGYTPMDLASSAEMRSLLSGYLLPDASSINPEGSNVAHSYDNESKLIVSSFSFGCP